MTDIDKAKAVEDFLAAITAPITNGHGEPPEEERSTWAPIDLTDALAGGDIPAPDILKRVDGVALIYKDKTHWFQGEPESCKTWLAGVCAVQVMETGENAGWIDFEDDERTAVARLKALGASTELIREHFVYIRPEEPLLDKQGRITRGHIDLEQVLEETKFGLLVLDGVTEAMVTEGLELLDNADIALWLRILPKRLAKHAPVICLDHVTKSKEGQGRWAIGGQHKLAGLTGAAYSFTTVKPFGRAMGTDMRVGQVFIKVEKDRAGYVRGVAVDGRVAVMELTSYPDGGVAVVLLTPDTTPEPDLSLCRLIAEHLNQYDGQSGRQIHMALGGREESLRAALKWMAAPERDWLAISKKGNSHVHTLTPKGRGDLL